MVSLRTMSTMLTTVRDSVRVWPLFFGICTRRLRGGARSWHRWSNGTRCVRSCDVRHALLLILCILGRNTPPPENKPAGLRALEFSQVN